MGYMHIEAESYRVSLKMLKNDQLTSWIAENGPFVKIAENGPFVRIAENGPFVKILSRPLITLFHSTAKVYFGSVHAN